MASCLVTDDQGLLFQTYVPNRSVPLSWESCCLVSCQIHPRSHSSEITLANVEGVAMKSFDRKHHLASVPRRVKSGKWQGGIPI